MASKASVGVKSIPKGVSVKQVKRSGGLWVVTYAEAGRQKQEWFDNKPTDEQIKAIEERLANNG